MMIRQASKEDIKAIANIYVDSWRTTYHGLVPQEYLDTLSYEKAEKKWIYFLMNERDPFIYVAINDAGNIIGFASGKRTDDENFHGELDALYISQEAKGLGTGKQLLSAVAKHFNEKGIHSMMVWVMGKNKSARGFYKRMGASEYIHGKSTIGGSTVTDVAYGWKDISIL